MARYGQVTLNVLAIYAHTSLNFVISFITVCHSLELKIRKEIVLEIITIMLAKQTD